MGRGHIDNDIRVSTEMRSRIPISASLNREAIHEAEYTPIGFVCGILLWHVHAAIAVFCGGNYPVGKDPGGSTFSREAPLC